jgi:heptaprenyl diphosphate synthase
MKTKKMAYMSLMIGYSLILYIIEIYIPNPLIVIFPGAKLGLTNIITLTSLVIFGLKDTFIIVSIRVLMSSIFTGPISYLMFSIVGAYLSLMFMTIALKTNKFSLIGVSVIGAIGHNIGQLIVASLIIKNSMIFGYLPYMLIASIITGIFVGITSKYMTLKLPYIAKNPY